MNYLFFLIPALSAFIGWVINWVTIKILFHPRTATKIVGISFQGIFPKRQQEFALTLGKLVSTEFLSFDNLEEKITSPENLKKILPMIETHIDDFLRHRLKEEMPMISMFIGDKTISTLKKSFMKEIETLFPLVMKQYAANLKTDLDLEQLVVKKIMGLSGDNLEKMLYQSLSKELRLLKMMGAVIGLCIGILQIILIYLLR